MSFPVRQRYDTTLIWLYSEQREHLIPESLRKRIPPSTASTWRTQVDCSSLIGYELRALHKDVLDQYEVFEQHRKLRCLVRCITRIWLVVSNVVLPILHKKKEAEEMLVENVQRLFRVLPRSLALKVAGLSGSAFRARLDRMYVRCGLSPLDQCRKRYPLQLSIREVRKIKALFVDPAKACWPAVSLYYHALRHERLFISLSTFYKYVNALGLKRQLKRPFAKTTGLQAHRPNQ